MKYRLVSLRDDLYLHLDDNGATYWGKEKGSALFDTFDAARLFLAMHSNVRHAVIVEFNKEDKS
jgi:hypothetical protein